MRKTLVALLMPMLLAACAIAPNSYYSDRNCVPPAQVAPVAGDDVLVDIAVTLIVDVTWYTGCEAVVGIANGVHDLRLAVANNGVYASPDHLFSVNVPDENGNMQIREKIRPTRDYVYFVSQTPGRPVYGISVIPTLPEKDASLSIEQFEKQATADLPKDASEGGVQLTGLQRVYQEQLVIDNKPTLFAVYRRDVQAGSARQPYNYLMYFVKKGNRAAILTVAWSGECAKCTKGPEARIEEMNPGIGKFVDSFRLADPGRTL